MVLWKQNVISSFWSTDKAPEQQIQALPVGSLSTICDKWEFDMTLSKSDVMKMQPACACACVADGRAWLKMDSIDLAESWH